MLAGAEFRVGHPIATGPNGLLRGAHPDDWATVQAVTNEMAEALGFRAFDTPWTLYLAMDTEGPRFLDRLRALLPTEGGSHVPCP